MLVVNSLFQDVVVVDLFVVDIVTVVVVVDDVVVDFDVVDVEVVCVVVVVVILLVVGEVDVGVVDVFAVVGTFFVSVFTSEISSDRKLSVSSIEFIGFSSASRVSVYLVSHSAKFAAFLESGHRQMNLSW